MLLFFIGLVALLVYIMVRSPYLPMLQQTDAGRLVPVLKSSTQAQAAHLSKYMFTLLNTHGIEFFLCGPVLLDQYWSLDGLHRPRVDLGMEFCHVPSLHALRQTLPPQYKLVFRQDRYEFMHVDGANVVVVIHIIAGNHTCTLNELGEPEAVRQFDVDTLYPLSSLDLFSTTVRIPRDPIRFLQDTEPANLFQNVPMPW